MDFTALLQKLERSTKENKQIFSDKKRNNDITGILYFDDEEYTSNANFLDDNDTETLYEIRAKMEEEEKLEEERFKQLCNKVKIYIELEEYNLSKKFDNLTDSILNVLKFYNYNGKNLFFKKLLKEFDVVKLYKKFNYKKQIKKTLLRNLIVKKEDTHDGVKQLLVDYLNINLVVVRNVELQTYYKEGTYELYRPTILIYEYDNMFYSISDKITNNSVFTSDDRINMVLQKYTLNQELLSKKKEESVIETMKKVAVEKKVKKKVEPLVNFKKMKVGELRNLCEQYHIATKEVVNGKNKNILKKDLVAQLKIIL